MIRLFGFFRDRISQAELEELETAEESLGISLVGTYKKLSKINRAVFMAHTKQYNKEHAEYLELKKRYDKAE